ncbi:MAG: ribulose-phosphate 3-epimerase [Bacilli bacterium]
MKEVSTSFLKEGDYSKYIEMLNYSDTDYIHFDVMDGKFVDNKNLSIKELEKYLKMSKKKNDVHLMVKNPEDYIKTLSLYNISYLTIHKEIKNYKEMINLIRSYGIKPGLAINPETNIKDIFEDLDSVSLILLMSVHPGRSGQDFIEETTNKISILKEEITKRNLNVKISIDGGIKEEVLDKVKDVDIIVSASFILNDLTNINKIKNC